MPIYESKEEDQFLPLRENVYKKLRHQILTGERRPGERLMEVHLAEELDVSRTPIREAIRKLELDGLVTIIPRSGAQVAEISEREALEVLEVRRVLDVLSAQLACRRIQDEDKIKLKQACSLFEHTIHSGDTEKIADADVALHNIIIHAAGNAKLYEIVHNLADHMYRYRFEYVKDDSYYRQLVQEHRALAEAIVSGDEEAATNIAGQHIDAQEKAVLRNLREKQQEKRVKRTTRNRTTKHE